jgi:hypothetical protein
MINLVVIFHNPKSQCKIQFIFQVWEDQMNIRHIFAILITILVLFFSSGCGAGLMPDEPTLPFEVTPTQETPTPPENGEDPPSDTPTLTPTEALTDTVGQPSETATVPEQPTSTLTPSYTPTTPPAAQIAPEDARFNNPLNIPLDNTVSVLDFVSFPDGDTEDRIRWDITGMNSNASLSGGRARLVIAVSCFGNGTQDVEIFTGGQTYSCGQTIVDQEVTFNSKTGQVTITAVGGQGTYVQWVLTGTASRIN